MLKDIIGRNITAMVTDENEKFVFAQKDGMTFRLDKSELIKLPKLGSMITGFAYENEKHQLQLTKILLVAVLIAMPGERSKMFSVAWGFLST